MNVTVRTRREFLQKSTLGLAGVGLFSALQPTALTASPNEKLRLALVGCTGRAKGNISGVQSEEIVCIADVDGNHLEQGQKQFPAARVYRDFRQMLEKEADGIDAVVISTPDHTHAPAAAMSLRLNKHCYCEKPLTHTVKEARVLADLARQRGLVTQMGTQIHAGDNYRRVVELIEQQAIGPVEEVHVWSNARYSGAKFSAPTPTPEHLNWDLWLGPAPERPYSKEVHPFKWRSFWDYGCGALGDFGCHFMDLAHWALRLRHPQRIVAQGPPVDAVSPPDWCIVRYDYPAREELPAVKLTWYDGGKRPELLQQMAAKDGKYDLKAGQLFVGRDGMLLSNYGSHFLWPEEKYADFQRPEPYIPKSIGHHAEWLQAIRNQGPTTCNFDYSGALTEAVLLGTVAYRSGQELQWDADRLQVTNSPDAQQWIHKEYRKGWDL